MLTLHFIDYDLCLYGQHIIKSIVKMPRFAIFLALQNYWSVPCSSTSLKKFSLDRLEAKESHASHLYSNQITNRYLMLNCAMDDIQHALL